MKDSRAWPIRPKWHRFETPKSYAQRQSAAAGIPFRDVERGLTSESSRLIYRVWRNAAEAAQTVEAAAGREQGHYLRLLQAAQPHPDQQYPDRFLCRLCAAGDVVEQIPHDRENWCKKHPGQLVWAGPGTSPDTQVVIPFGTNQARAERIFRRLAAAGRISTRLHARVWEMVRDNASLSQPSGWSDALRGRREDHETLGRAELYPVVVGVLRVLSNEALVSRWVGLAADELRPAIRVALPPMDGPRDILVERIVLWLRPHRREIRPTRIDSLNVPLDLVDAASIIDTEAVYPLWVQRNPAAVAEWNWDENAPDRDPWDSSGITSAKATWACDAGHQWTATPYVRAVAGCPCCSGQLVWRGQSDLETLFPDVASEWDQAEGVNAGSPNSVSPGSRRRIAWVCAAEGHRWVATISNRALHGSGCPACAGKRAIPGVNDLATVRPDLAAQWHPSNPLRPEQVLPRYAKKVLWQCARGHVWAAKPDTRAAGQGCPFCAGRRVILGETDLATRRPDLASEWHDSNTRLPQAVMVGSRYRAVWKCRFGHLWEATINNRTNRRGTGCPVCSRSNRIGNRS